MAMRAESRQRMHEYLARDKAMRRVARFPRNAYSRLPERTPLLAAGQTPNGDVVAAAANWLIVEQQPAGCWRESQPDAASPTLTALSLHALTSAGRVSHRSALRAVEYLLDSQGEEGNWLDQHFARFDPNSNYYVRNDLYAAAWGLSALSNWAVVAGAAQSADTDQLSLSLVGAAAVN